MEFVDKEAALGHHYVLLAEFDSLEEQARKDPEYSFPQDTCSRLIAFLMREWCEYLEDLQEYVHWSDDQTRVQIEVDELSNLEDPIHFLMWHAVPRQLCLIRDVSKEDIDG